MYTVSSTNYIPHGNWNKMGTQTANVSTVATTMCPPVNIGTSVNRFLEFVRSMWNPFSSQKTDNPNLLKFQSEGLKDSVFETNIDLIVDLLVQPQLLPRETKGTTLGFSFSQIVKFEHVLSYYAAHPFEEFQLPPDPLKSVSCDLAFSPSKTNSLFSHPNRIIPSKSDMENVLIIKNFHVTENMHKGQVLGNAQEKALCPYQPVNRDNLTSTVNIQTVICVLPETSISKTTATKVVDNSISTLNRELVIRKSKKVTKMAKRWRRRQRKNTKKVDSSNVRNKPKISLNSPKQHFDDDEVDFQVFDEPGCPKATTSSRNDSVSSDDCFIEFGYDETEVTCSFVNRAIASESVINSESEDDSHLNESSDDFCIDFGYEDEVDCSFVNPALVAISKPLFNSESEDDSPLNESSDDFCIAFGYEDEVDCLFVNPALTVISKPMFNSESEDDSDLNNSYDNREFDDLNFNIEACFISGLSSVCTALVSSSMSDKTVCSDDSDVPELSLELQKVNEQWERDILNVPSDTKSSRALTKKVSFACDQDLVAIFSVEVYERKGEWEIYALERFRFKRRIEDVEKILSPCLSKSHRDSVWLRLKSNLV